MARASRISSREAWPASQAGFDLVNPFQLARSAPVPFFCIFAAGYFVSTLCRPCDRGPRTHHIHTLPTHTGSSRHPSRREPWRGTAGGAAYCHIGCFLRPFESPRCSPPSARVILHKRIRRASRQLWTRITPSPPPLPRHRSTHQHASRLCLGVASPSLFLAPPWIESPRFART